MKAQVIVRLKQDVMDPQGKAVLGALHSLGHSSVTDVRVGRFFDVSFAPGTDSATAKALLETMSEQLLANPVIEDFEINVDKDGTAR